MRSRVLLILLSVVSAAAVFARENKPPWKMSGQLEEACSCNAACPCWFGSMPTRAQCSGGFVLFIDHGSYGNVPLDGLGLAFMGASKTGTTMMESMGDWDFMPIYIDEKANPEQRKALEAIARETSPPAAPPERTHVSYVPLTRKLDGSEHIVTIGNVGGFSAHLLPGGMGGTPKIVNPPGRRSDPQGVRAGRHDEADLQRLGQEMGLVQLELHVRHVRHRQRRVREVRRRHGPADAEGEGREALTRAGRALARLGRPAGIVAREVPP